jgi:hypothetical protein
MVEAIVIGYATSARWRAMARWSSRSLASAGVPRAILVDRLTLDGVYLLLGQAVAISCATDIHAFVFSGVGRQQGEGRGICVARIQGSRPQWQKRCEDHADAAKVPPTVFHGFAPSGPNIAGLTCRRLCEFGSCKKKYRLHPKASAARPVFLRARASGAHRAAIIAARRG